MLMGSSSSGGSVSGMQTTSAMINRPWQGHRTFNGGDIPATFAQSECQFDPANNWASAWSFQAATTAALNTIASGASNTKITNWIKSVPAGQRVTFAFCHEADHKVAQASCTPADVNAAYATVGALMDTLRSQGVSQVASGNVKLALCLTNNNFNGKGSATQDRFNTAIQAADVFALDIYGGAAGSNRNFPNYSSDFLAWWNAAGARPKQNDWWEIWETSADDTGTGSVANKTAWINDSISISFANGCKAYYCWNSGGGAQDYISAQTYADTFRTNYDQYADGASTPPPPQPPPSTPGPYAPAKGSFHYIRLG